MAGLRGGEVSPSARPAHVLPQRSNARSAKLAFGGRFPPPLAGLLRRARGSMPQLTPGVPLRPYALGRMRGEPPERKNLSSG